MTTTPSASDLGTDRRSPPRVVARGGAVVALGVLSWTAACGGQDGGTEIDAGVTTPAAPITPETAEIIDPTTTEPVVTTAPSTSTTSTTTSSTTTTVLPTTTVAPTTTTVVPSSGLAASPDTPVEASSAQEFVGRLMIVASDLFAYPTLDPSARSRLGHEHQVLVRTAATHPEWIDEIETVAGPGPAETLRGLVDAGRVAAGAVPPLEVIPAWRIRTPPSAEELRAHAEAAETATGTPAEVLLAIGFVETRLGRIVGLSSAGAQGPMQFLPGTWQIYGEGGDPYDDGDAIAAAGRLLAANGAPEELASAVFSYNHSNAYVTSVLAYADLLAAEPALFDALWGWQVYVVTSDGLQWLPEGFSTDAPLSVEEARAVLPPAVARTG